MSRPIKDHQPFSMRMDKTTYKRLSDYCEESGQSKTVAVERAINMFIDSYKEKMKLLDKN